MKKIKLNIQMFASTNKTANYELPQFVGTDKPSWLGDFNEAMSDIDAGMHENASDIAEMATDVATASATASQASSDVSTLTSTVNSLSGDVTSATSTANNAQSTATSALNTANTANGKADTNASAITSLQSDVADTLVYTDETQTSAGYTVQLKDRNANAKFPNSAVASSSGLLKLADGTLIEYGKESVGVSHNTTQDKTITFSEAFISEPNVYVTMLSTNSDAPRYVDICCASITTTTAKLRARNTATGTTGYDFTIGFEWLVVGRWK